MHRSCKISGLADALTERGIVSPSPIQQLVMPKLAQGCLASERCIGLYYRYIMWYVYGASMFFSVTIMRKKKAIHCNCMGVASDIHFFTPLKWTMEMANYIIVMKLTYIYIYQNIDSQNWQLFAWPSHSLLGSRRWAYHRPCTHRGWEDLGLSPADAGETSAAWANWGIHKRNM